MRPPKTLGYKSDAASGPAQHLVTAADIEDEVKPTKQLAVKFNNLCIWPALPQNPELPQK